jgi:hypothetical protein
LYGCARSFGRKSTRQIAKSDAAAHAPDIHTKVDQYVTRYSAATGTR